MAANATRFPVRGFTLLELLLAVSILAAVTTVTFMTFYIVTTAWRRGTVLSGNLEQGDYVADQLVMALRSAYYPDAGAVGATYGFWNEDGGGGPAARDRISWVKLGYALVGEQAEFAESPHRVEFFLEPGADGSSLQAMVRAWRLQGQAEDFDPETDVDPVPLSNRVLGFDCRTAYQKVDDEIEWLDEWTETNRLPTVVEIVLYLQPPDPDDDPVEVRRVIGPPVALLSWSSVNADAGTGPGGAPPGRGPARATPPGGGAVPPAGLPEAGP